MDKSIAFIFFGVTLLFCENISAQKKSFTGFYVSTAGDTIKGFFPDYSQWSKNPSQVKFSTTASSEAITLTPANTRSFAINGQDEYRGYIGVRLINPIDDYKVVNAHYTRTKDEEEEITTFLRLVTRTSKCELYALSDNQRVNFFYSLPKQQPVELRYKKYLNDTTTTVLSGTMINQLWDYKNQLYNEFTQVIADRDARAYLEKLTYTEDALAGFIEYLFPDKLRKKAKNPLAGWVASVGATINMIEVVRFETINNIPSKYNSAVSPILSAGYYTPIGRSFGRYFLFPQVSLFKHKNTGEVVDGNFRKVTTYETSANLTGVVTAGVNVINQKDVRVFLSAGLGMMTLLGNKRLDVSYLASSQSTEPYRSEQKKIAVAATPEISAAVGTVIKSKIFLTAGYVLPATIDNVYKARFSAVQLQIGYKLH